MKILDCTLRDGGYIIDWNFGKNRVSEIINNLVLAGIDYIECGFLKEEKSVPGKTFFSSVEELKKLDLPEWNYTLMVNFGEYGIENFGECKDKKVKIRVAFKKNKQKEALEYIYKLKNLGYDVFANPMHTNIYSQEELLKLIDEINQIKPYGLTIVDTLGNMYEKDVVSIFSLIDNNLNSEISIGFHSHNSMQLSFSNTKALLKLGIKRKIIIDSCVYGMGRGAGNLCTELIIKYLNDNYSKDYKMQPVLKILDDLKTIYKNSPWGYSIPYYIAARHSCHPNYAGFLSDLNLSNEKIEEIINCIPEEKKISYDKEFIKNLVSRLFL